jgi:uncharacterized protein (DUF58 family)
MQPPTARTWKSLLWQASRHQVTTGGLVFTLAVLLVGIAAVISANNLLFLILAAMLSTMMVSGFISRLSLAGLELDFVLPEHISARRKLAARVRVRNSKRMPSFSVRLTGAAGSVLSPLYFPVIPGRTALEEMVDVCFGKRGVHRENSFQFSTGFPFGFLERRAGVALGRDVLVYPSIEPEPGFEELLSSILGELETQHRGRGGDFYRIRPYEALESARHVDWKATAHTGELQVREFAREQDRQLEIFLDLDVPAGREAWFERAVDCCAFLAWRLAERGGRLRLRSQEFDTSIPEAGDVYTILRLLALVTPSRGKQPVAPDDESSYQIVFTAADAGRMAELGWDQASILGSDTFAGPAAGAAGCDRASEDLHHGG